MANRTISISYKLENGDQGFKKLVVDAKEFEKAIDGVAQRVKGLNSKGLDFGQIQTGLESLSRTLSGISGVFTDLSQAYAVQEEAETKLATVMRERMNASDASIQSIKDLCSAQQELGIIGDEVQLAGAQQLSTFLKSEDALRTLIPAMNNLVAQQKGYSATGGDAVNIGNLLGKAFQGQTSALRRVGITFSEAEEKAVKFGSEEERAAALARIITNNVGEMNQSLAQTPSGQLKQLQNHLGDIKERLGGAVKEITPFVTGLNQMVLAGINVVKVFSGITTVTGWISEFAVKMTHAAKAASGLKLAIGGLGLAAVVGIIAAVRDAISSATSETERLKRAQQAVNEVRAQAAQRLAEQQSKIEILIRTAQNEKNGLDERKKAVDELNRIIPNYNAQLDASTGKYRANAKALAEYNKQLLRQYEIEGAKDQLKKIAADKAQKMVELNTAKKELRDAYRLRDRRSDAMNETGISAGLNARESGLINNSEKTRHAFDIKGKKEEVQDLRDAVAELGEQAKNVMNVFGNDLTGGAPPAVPDLENETYSPRGTGHHTPTTTPEPPEGSLSALRKQMQEIEAKINITVDPQQIAELVRTKQDLQKQIDVKVDFVKQSENFWKILDGPQELEVGVKTDIDADLLTGTLQELPETFGRTTAEVQALIAELADAERKENALAKRTKNISQLMGALPQIMNAASSAFSGLGEAFDSKELNVAGIIAGAIANIVAGYASATAQQGESGNPWVWLAFTLAGLAEVVGVVTQVKSLTAFAEGGVVSGPTMALVGEYAGASNNPEVIAPLDKLKSLLGDNDSAPSGPMTVRLEVEGSKLVGVLNNTTRIAARAGRHSKIK